MGADQQEQQVVEPAEQFSVGTLCLIPFNQICLLRISLDLFSMNEEVETDTDEEDVGSGSIEGTDYEDYELYEL